jgi:Phage tail tube protein
MTQAQGSRGTLGIQYESTFGIKPSTDAANTPLAAADLTKVYFESEGFKASQNLVSSAILTGSRHSTRPIKGNIDVQGSIATELGGGIGMLLYGACGSISSAVLSGSETVSTAFTTPAGVIDAVAQTITVTCSAIHSLVVGDTVAVAGLTLPTELNGLSLRVVKVTSTMIFVARIPANVGTTFTLGSGTMKKVTSAATAYTHTIKSGGALPSFFVEKGFSDIGQFFTYPGLKVGKMSINLSPEGVQKCSFDFTGTTETVGTTTYDPIPIDLFKSSFAGYMIGSVTESGSTNVLTNKVTKIDLSLDNALDTGVYCIGGAGSRSALPEGVCKVTGTVETVFENRTQYDKAVASTETDLTITITNGTGAGTAGNEKLTIFIPELVFKQETPVIGGDKGVMVTLAFEAYYDNSSDKSGVKLTLLNSTMTI